MGNLGSGCSALWTVFDTALHPDAMTLIVPYFHVFSRKLLDNFLCIESRLQCYFPSMNYTKGMVVATLGPIVFVAIVYLYYLISSLFCAPKSEEEKVKRSHRYTHAFLIATYIVIIGSSTKPIHCTSTNK